MRSNHTTMRLAALTILKRELRTQGVEGRVMEHLCLDLTNSINRHWPAWFGMCQAERQIPLIVQAVAQLMKR